MIKIKKKILVVDDEENIRLLFQEELEEEGYDVITAQSGEEAIGKIDMVNPDLVTIDIRMDGIDGINAMRKIKEIKHNLPVIICTAHGEYRDDFGSWASEAYVIKSGNLDELKRKIYDLLN
ncbi:MAG: response regulator [Nitrospirota bacterium]